MPARDYLFASPPKPYFPIGSALATRLHYMVGQSHGGLLEHALQGNQCPIDGAIMTAAHALTCKGTSAYHKTNMHDCIRAELVRSFRAISGAVVIEEHQMRKYNKSRLDLIVDIAGQRFGVDYSACEVASSIKNQPTTILSDRYRTKKSKYAHYAELFNQQYPDQPKMKIIPLIFTTYGTPTQESHEFLKLIKTYSKGDFSVKSALCKIAAISAHYNHGAVQSWRLAVTHRLDPQSHERPNGSKWQPAFQRWKAAK